MLEGRARARRFCIFLKVGSGRPEARQAFRCSGRAQAQETGPMAGAGPVAGFFASGLARPGPARGMARYTPLFQFTGRARTSRSLI